VPLVVQLVKAKETLSPAAGARLGL
jgi:hypothetical protein